MKKEKFCLSCSKWRLAENGEVVKRRNSSCWRCAFCTEKAKQAKARAA